MCNTSEWSDLTFINQMNIVLDLSASPSGYRLRDPSECRARTRISIDVNVYPFDCTLVDYTEEDIPKLAHINIRALTCSSS